MKAKVHLLLLILTPFVWSGSIDVTFAQTDLEVAALKKINPRIAAAPPIDFDRVKAAGVEVYSGKHLILFTDLRDSDRAADLVAAFDAAVPQWCKIFGVPAKRATGWKVRGFLMVNDTDHSRFNQAKLFPKDLPKFPAGYQQDHNLWLYAQPGSYYTRHLLLHEGTHAFMQWFLNGYGPPWYSEGNAELLGVHAWKDRKLELKVRLRDRSEAPFWGRVKQIQEEHAASEGMSLEEMLSIPSKAFRQVRYYAWAWAGCEFFSNHPLTREKFKALSASTQLAPQEFNQRFRNAIDADWNQLQTDWNLFIDEMDYGYEIPRGCLANARKKPDINGGSKVFSIDAARSWQKSGIKVRQGERVRVTGKGRFKVGQTTAVTKTTKNAPATEKIYPWTSEANGITIDYYRGRPLGMLDAGVLLAPTDKGPQIRVVPIGSGRQTIVMPADGELCFRINESPSHLDDNQGGLEVTVEPIK